MGASEKLLKLGEDQKVFILRGGGNFLGGGSYPSAYYQTCFSLLLTFKQGPQPYSCCHEKRPMFLQEHTHHPLIETS